MARAASAGREPTTGAPSPGAGLRLAEVMAAMSLATDVGMGQPMEQGLGVCLVAVRFGEGLGLDDGELRRLYDIALLRHIGCTAETVGFASIMGDELAARRRGGSFVDWGRPAEALGYMVGTVAAGSPPLRAARRIARLPAALPRLKAGAIAVCEVAELLAQRFGIGAATRDELVAVYERWDGRGFPGRLSGEAIPLVARIVQLAEAARMFAAAEGADAAVAMLRRRAGGAYDPQLVERFCRSAGELLGALEQESLWEATLAQEPAPRPPMEGAALDAALRAMGEFADLKSPATVGHSAGVADLAAGAAAACGLPEGDRTQLRRCGWVHDVGRVGVSSLVWEKPGPLSHGEREQVRLHPYYTERMLARPARLAEIGRLAATHHERLDGSGYHRGVPAALLTPAARILAAADCYRAMTEARPHRAALPAEAAAAALSDEVRAGRLDGNATAAVLTAAGHSARRRPAQVAGLTGRELEVLRLLARGLSIRQIAERLVIAPKTADAHIQHIYGKIGVSTRAAATMFAMQHDLVD
jgi:HD-GYP domain-containing protein (c-di-GMP phosphodiesterase class II)